MVSANTLVRDFNLLDKDLVNLELQSKKVVENADKNGEEAMKNFITSLRMVHEANEALTTHNQTLQDLLTHASVKMRHVEEKITKTLSQIRSGDKFLPTEFAGLLEEALDHFELMMSIQLRYQPNTEKMVNDANTNIRRRKMLIEDMQRTFESRQFDSMMTPTSRSHMKSKLEVLADKRYADLLESILMLAKLMNEFNTRLHNIYVATSDLEMVKGTSVEPQGFFSKLMGRGKMTIPLELSSSDKKKIVAVQGWVHVLHEVTVKAMRERQQAIIRELRQIKEDEADLRSAFKKGFSRGEHRIQRMAA